MLKKNKHVRKTYEKYTTQFKDTLKVESHDLSYLYKEYKTAINLKKALKLVAQQDKSKSQSRKLKTQPSLPDMKKDKKKDIQRLKINHGNSITYNFKINKKHSQEMKSPELKSKLASIQQEQEFPKPQYIEQP